MEFGKVLKVFLRTDETLEIDKDPYVYTNRILTVDCPVRKCTLTHRANNRTFEECKALKGTTVGFEVKYSVNTGESYIPKIYVGEDEQKEANERTTGKTQRKRENKIQRSQPAPSPVP